MPTIQDVAKRAGVSAATVSRVLNNNESVAPKTKNRVQSVIDELNYQPNLLGRNLRRSETRMILVLLQNISNPFYSRIVKGMEEVAHKNDYNVLMCNTNTDAKSEQIYLNFLRNKLVDGVIFTSPAMGVDKITKLAKQYPVVLCNEYEEGIVAPIVTIDNEVAGYDATKHLINLGHRRIAFLSATGVSSSYLREQGYKRAMIEASLPVKEDYIIRDTFSYKSGIRGIKKLLNLKEIPTAVFCVSDSIAIGVIKELKNRRLEVPKDMAVMGFDDNSIAVMYDPAITTIAQPRYDIGRTTMEIMLKRIKGDLDGYSIIKMEHELIIRESTVHR